MLTFQRMTAEDTGRAEV